MTKHQQSQDNKLKSTSGMALEKDLGALVAINSERSAFYLFIQWILIDHLLCVSPGTKR